MQELPFIAVGGGLAGAAFALPAAACPCWCLKARAASSQSSRRTERPGLAPLGATSAGRFWLATGGRCAEAQLPFRGAGLSRCRGYGVRRVAVDGMIGLPGLPCGRWGSIAAQPSSDNQNKCVIAAFLSVRLNEGRVAKIFNVPYEFSTWGLIISSKPLSRVEAALGLPRFDTSLYSPSRLEG